MSAPRPLPYHGGLALCIMSLPEPNRLQTRGIGSVVDGREMPMVSALVFPLSSPASTTWSPDPYYRGLGAALTTEAAA